MESLIQSANQNLAMAFRRIPVAWLLAKKSIQFRYRRSIIGPFWITLSQAVYVLVLGVVFATVFKQKGAEMIPFVTCGALTLSFISSVLQESSTVLIEKGQAIRDGDQYFLTHVLETVFHGALIFAHHTVILVIVVVVCKVPLHWYDVPAAISGLLLICLNLIGLGFLLSLLTPRYRDLGPLIASALRTLFFLTPIMWKPEFLGDKEYLVDYNPLHHWINLVREPLIGGDYRLHSLWVTVGTCVIAWALAYFVFIFCHRRLPTWI